MKKISSIMLSLVLLLNLSITVFAEEDTIASASDAQSATGQNIIGTGIAYPEEQPQMISESDESSVIDIEITWGAMNFTYSDEQVDGSDKGWTCETDANTVMVENYSTVSVKAECSYKPADSYKSIDGQITGGPEILSEDVTAIFTLTLSGKPDAALSGAEIGSVTVTITNADNQSNAVAIADENGDETAEGVNKTEDSNAALDEEPNGTETVTETEENSEDGDEAGKGTETESEDLNAALDEEANGTETVTETEENSEDGNEPNEGAESKTDDQNTALDEGSNDTDTVTDTVEDTEEVSSEIGDEGQTTE